MVTKAGSALRQHLQPPERDKPRNQSELAKLLKVSPQAVSAWINGETLPSPQNMAAIEDLFPDVKMRDWVEADAEDSPTGGRAA